MTNYIIGHRQTHDHPAALVQMVRFLGNHESFTVQGAPGSGFIACFIDSGLAGEIRLPGKTDQASHRLDQASRRPIGW